jgi:hypothetical protein
MVGDLAGPTRAAQIRQLERGFQDHSLFLRPQPVPHRSRLRVTVHQPGLAPLAIATLPTIERRARQSQLGNRPALGLRRTSHQLDHLAFLLRTHLPVPPPFQQPLLWLSLSTSLVTLRSATSLFPSLVLPAQGLYLVTGGLAQRVA